MIEYKELTPQEVDALALTTPVAPGSLVLGAYEDGELVALLGALTVVLVDPLWVSPPHRKTPKVPGILLRLWDLMKSRLALAGVGLFFADADDSQPIMSRLFHRLGGVEIQGKRHFIFTTGGNHNG